MEKGKEYKDGKLIYEGEYLNEQKNAVGKEYNYQDGSVLFEGEYKYGEKWNGNGKIFNYEKGEPQCQRMF